MTQRFQVQTANQQIAGVVVNHGRGWKFIPWTDAATSSRKLWETPEAALKGRVKGYILVAA